MQLANVTAQPSETLLHVYMFTVTSMSLSALVNAYFLHHQYMTQISLINSLLFSFPWNEKFLLKFSDVVFGA